MEMNLQGNSSAFLGEPIEKEETPLFTSNVGQPVETEESEIHGLAQEEMNDPNKIIITIADKQNPIIVLFGPPACGKTMTLVRLTRFLKQQGYKVEPITSFRPAVDIHYANMCHEYNEMINRSDAADQTSRISFMLVRVLDNVGRTICQILEAPGELYFDPKKPNQDFPRYVHAIKASDNRKIWCYFVEPDPTDPKERKKFALKDQADRDGYVDKIHKLKRDMRPKDKAVFVFNKIDLTPFVISPGRINEKQARREVENLYPGIFVPFRSKGVFGTSDNFRFIPFQTGYYSETYTGEFSFEPGSDEYPKTLWNTIKKLVKG